MNLPDPVFAPGAEMPPSDDTHGARIERVLAMARPPAATVELRLASGELVRASQEQVEHVTLRGPDGAVALSIRFTVAGPVLSFAAAELELATKGRLALACESLTVHARQDIEMDAGGAVRAEGHHVALTSRRGDIHLRANDDVRIDGEEVLLNC